MVHRFFNTFFASFGRDIRQLIFGWKIGRPEDFKTIASKGFFMKLQKIQFLVAY